MRMPSIMDDLLACASQRDSEWFQTNVKLFIQVCKLHGDTAIGHHNQLVSKFIAQPAQQMQQQHMQKVTASGPPLHVLLDSLEKLRDRRAAAKRDDIKTRYADLSQLKQWVKK